MSSVANPKLKNAVDQIYRPGATVGDGGLADAIRHEKETGEMVGGHPHTQKGRERLKNLENILAKEKLNEQDAKTIKKLISDLKQALEDE
jgi:tRNA C32,U32 (ribose-2'-O)-methylase TrmJ